VFPWLVGAGSNSVLLFLLACRLSLVVFLFFCLESDPCTLFHLLPLLDLVVAIGIGTVSLYCLACSFFLLLALATAFVSLSLSIFILLPCHSLVTELYCCLLFFFLQVALLTAFPFLYSLCRHWAWWRSWCGWLGCLARWGTSWLGRCRRFAC